MVPKRGRKAMGALHESPKEFKAVQEMEAQIRERFEFLGNLGSVHGSQVRSPSNYSITEPSALFKW